MLWFNFWKSEYKDILKPITGDSGGISAIDAAVVFLQIIENNPRYVIEFSPNKGYSTTAIALAMKTLNKPGCFASFEIRAHCAQETQKKIKNLGLEPYAQIITGNALVEVPKFISEKSALVDLCFIDSDHGKKFAKSYISNIFPVLQPNCLIFAHDICTNKLNNNGEGAIQTSLTTEDDNASGEYKVLAEFLKNKTYQLTHAVFGGKHEKADLSINTEAYDELGKITGIRFDKLNNRICPKLLLFRL